jgi:hypothetical protein
MGGGAGEAGERGLGAKPAVVGPADQNLCGAQGADAGQLCQLRVDVVDQAGDVVFELVRLGLDRGVSPGRRAFS